MIADLSRLSQFPGIELLLFTEHRWRNLSSGNRETCIAPRTSLSDAIRRTNSKLTKQEPTL